MDGNKDVCNISLDVNQINNKTYKNSCLATIIKTVCALLNSAGGILHLNFPDSLVSEEKQENVLSFVKSFEQHIVGMIGQCKYCCLVKQLPPLQITNEQYIFEIEASPSLCTVHYHLYLSTTTQVIQILPFEPINHIIQIFNQVLQPQLMPETGNMILNQKLSFGESATTQFKCLKADNSKCVSLADRIVNKSNKLLCYVSAFAHQFGGCIYYGITDKAVVKGEELERKNQQEIDRKVTKAIDKMTWLGGKLERGKHWSIKFEPVKDKNMKEIPSLFVIIVSVEPLSGGVFAQKPESYYRVNGETELMPFNVWKDKFFNGRTEDVPQCVGRIRWSSQRKQIIYNKVLQLLVMHGNNANFDAFKKSAMQAKNNYKGTDVGLMILKEDIVAVYKKGSFQKANRMLAEYKHLTDTLTQDHGVFLFFGIYIESAILRAEGNFQQSYDVAKEGLQLAEILPAGLHIAWFYNHVSIVEKRLSQEIAETQARDAYSRASDRHFQKALQHTKASEVDQMFPDIVADARQRIHICHAITCLGNFASGADIENTTQSNVKEAQDDLIVYEELVNNGHEPTKYRMIYSSLATSDLRLCQWCLQQQQQQLQQQQPCDKEADISLLVKSFRYAEEAHQLSKQSCFEELKVYAKARMAVATEVMIRENVKKIGEKFKNIRQKFQK